MTLNQQSTVWTVAMSHLSAICFCGKGLPTEISLAILDEAGYVPCRRLRIAHDPLHGENEAELTKYLTECWLLLVRTQVVAEALGLKIEWGSYILSTIEGLWGCKYCRLLGV